jgi:hypothetical protein
MFLYEYLLRVPGNICFLYLYHSNMYFYYYLYYLNQYKYRDFKINKVNERTTNLFLLKTQLSDC